MQAPANIPLGSHTTESSPRPQAARITTCLWFDKQAEEAATFYVKVFSEAGRSAKIGRIARYGDAAAKASGQAKGSVMTVEFELDGNPFLGLNGGPIFKLSPATSFIVQCATQEEIDYFWNRLAEGGKEGRCGWIDRDQFGISWQVVPSAMADFASDPDPERSRLVMSAVMTMTKLDLAALWRAYNGK